MRWGGEGEAPWGRGQAAGEARAERGVGGVAGERAVESRWSSRGSQSQGGSGDGILVEEGTM